MFLAKSCTSGTPTIELRVDVINATDISEGYAYPPCNNINNNITSTINSYNSAYRGHFMQVHNTFYGALWDTHQ